MVVMTDDWYEDFQAYQPMTMKVLAQAWNTRWFEFNMRNAHRSQAFFFCYTLIGYRFLGHIITGDGVYRTALAFFYVENNAIIIIFIFS